MSDREIPKPTVLDGVATVIVFVMAFFLSAFLVGMWVGIAADKYRDVLEWTR